MQFEICNNVANEIVRCLHDSVALALKALVFMDVINSICALFEQSHKCASCEYSVIIVSLIVWRTSVAVGNARFSVTHLKIYSTRLTKYIYFSQLLQIL